MQPSTVVNKASTVYVAFPREMPKLFVVFRDNGIVEYFRYMDGKTPRMKFNLPLPGNFFFNVPVQVLKIVDVEIPDLPTLPPAERDRLKGEATIIYDPNWTDTPASNFTNEGIIVHGPGWKRLIPHVRFFIDLHEYGHFFYREEASCDLYAFVNFMRMGYNKSTAYYTLTKVLRRNPQSIDRIKKLFSTIVKSDGEFSPE